MPSIRLLSAVGLAAAGLFVSGAVFAHDHWINHGRYVGVDGVHCCGPNDCFEVAGNDIKVTATGYELLSYRETVPFREAQASEDGKYWRCRKFDGSRRCFFAPQPGV